MPWGVGRNLRSAKELGRADPKEGGSLGPSHLVPRGQTLGAVAVLLAAALPGLIPTSGPAVLGAEPGFHLRAQNLGEKSPAGHTQEKNKGVWDSAKLLVRETEDTSSTRLLIQGKNAG